MDFSAYLIPLLLAFVALFGIGRRVDVYGALSRGAEEGLRILLRILPALVGLLTAVHMLRASGAMDLLENILRPVLIRLGIPPETAALLLIRPVSGSGALAIGSELMAAHGPDSYIGRVAAVMLGSTETTFYTIAVYFGSAGIRRTRYAIPAALAADLAGFIAAAFTVRLLFRRRLMAKEESPVSQWETGLCFSIPRGDQSSPLCRRTNPSPSRR